MIFLCTLLSLHPFPHRLSAAAPAPRRDNSPWFAGCTNTSSGLYAPGGARDLDPVTCSARCLDEGYPFAALTSEGCYCGNWQHGPVACECVNTSSSGVTHDGRGDRHSVLSLPVGGGPGSVALYRTEGPFLRSVRVAARPRSVQPGKTFVVEVSGSLAGRPDQPAGILGADVQDLSYVTVEIQESSRKGQSSHHVNVLDDGSFVVTSHWILETAGESEFSVSVSNPLSTLSSTLRLSVVQPPPPPPPPPPPHSLVISVLHGPLGIPYCLPLLPTDSPTVAVDAVYLGDPVTLQAGMTDDLAVNFSWCFTHKEEGGNTGGMKTACLSDCLNSTVEWTFETEGLHVVSVNVSGVSGWTQETKHVAVVRPTLSDLRLSVPGGSQLTSGEGVSVDVELLATVKRPLILNLTLSPGHGSSDTKDTLSSSGGRDLSDDDENTTNVNEVENHTGKSEDHNSPNRDIINCHGGTLLHLRSDTHLRLSNCSGCRLHLRLRCRLPTSAGRYLLTASVLSASDPSSALLSTTLPHALMVYEDIHALRPSGSWRSAVSSHANFSLEVVSPSGRTGSRVIWTFSLDDVIVTSRATEEWKINVSLAVTGCYKVTVKACNPISWASFCTHVFVQDPVGDLVLTVPRVITVNRKHSVSFSVTAGTNVTVSLLVNAELQYTDSSYKTGKERTVVFIFNHTGTAVVVLRAENRVSSQNKSVRVCVERNRKPSPQVRINPTWQSRTNQNVWIHAAKQAYPTNSDVSFLAVAEVTGPAEFLWHFGDSKPARTTSRTITKRYHKPGRYDVVVVMVRGRTSVTSDVFSLVVQRAVKLNRLLHPASVLLDQTVTASCRVSTGTDVDFLWSFGDGSSRLGQHTEQHVFHRTGEFTITVTVSNLVSSASLSGRIFVVDRPCQPPPVKNTGPLKLQVRRHEVVRLGVTYEAEVDCDISGGLRYTWTLFDSAGRVFPLLLIDAHKQSLTLPSHLLGYDTYTAVAKVQIIGTVVYSNYSVRVQVIPSPPVAFIQGGTNIFINNRNATVVTLDGQRSYDPDFPTNPIGFSWTCKPVSSITSSCFQQDVPTSYPALVFPASFLKHSFDQFQFTLTVRSGERSASSEAFLTVTSNVIGKVSVSCLQCQGEQVNWDQSFTVSALCEGCAIDPKYIHYAWSLYLVNASSKPIVEVPFCHAVDLSAPSAILEATSTLHPPPTDASQYIRPVRPSAPVSLFGGETLLTDSGFLLKNNREKSTVADLTQPEPQPISSLVRAAGSGEEPFYHPLGEFDPPQPLYSPTEYQPPALDNSSVLYSDHFGQNDVISEFPIDSSADWQFSLPVLEGGGTGGRPDLDYDVPVMSAEEGDPGFSAGRPTGVEGATLSPGGGAVFDPMLHQDEGSYLVDSRPSVETRQPVLLDLSRELVARSLFESFTYTGASSPSFNFRPFSLRPGSRYMLEVTAESHESFLGRTQLFLKTNPAPKGMMCQVQPMKGTELHTQFSVFCTSGKEDLIYKYSIRVGDRPDRMLYQGRDFQYYFSLPSGDPSDDYKVTISTEIRSSTYGTATKPCPVTVRVRPSFIRDASSSSARLDPDLELSQSGLRNLSALVRLGNTVEVRNYVSLLTSILNRLSMDTEADTRAQTCTRNVLIDTLCELESRDQPSMVDNICILTNLLQVTSQVTFASARRVALHVQAISEQFSESSDTVSYSLDQEALNTLVALLSYSLQAAVTNNDFTPEVPNSADIKQASESDSHEGNIRHAVAPFNGCIPESSGGVYTKRAGSISAQQTVQLVADILQTAADLMLRHILFQKAREHRFSNSFIALYAAHQNQTSAVISSGSTAFFIPASLIQLLFVHRRRESRPHRPCVLSMLTELTHSPFASTHYPGRLRGPVVDLGLYECSTRRKIPVRYLVQPINIELQQPPINESSHHEHILRRNQVNYHSFNFTQEHLQQAIQLSVVFRLPLDKAFPIMLLFRMFERPTPSVHHLYRVHHWESNTARVTLPSSYLTAAGTAHLALLSADFGKAPTHRHLSEEVSYSLTADSSLCLSWDGHQGAWTHHGCRTQQGDTAGAINCSCHQLRPLAVVQQQIPSSYDTADLDPFLSVSGDLTVLGVLVLCVCLYVPGLVACRRADVASEENRRVHYLPDNSPGDPHLYAVTVHTGPSSAARMSAKVYIVLHGEDGVSQTRQLQVPGCTLFSRNCKDTFLLSAPDSLGPVCRVHVWHDDSGPSPSWYLKQVEVSEVSGGRVKGRAWLFVAQCWLAVDQGDGRVERTLRVCTQGIGFAKMLRLRLSDYLADHHIWISVLRCPRPNPFTHTQRLSVSLMLLLGYACVNTAFISVMDDQLLFEVGITDVSAVSVTTGVLSVIAALPAPAIISFLFRLRGVKLTGSAVRHAKGRETGEDFCEDSLSVTDSASELHLSWSRLQQWAQEAWRKKYQGSDLLPPSTTLLESKATDKAPVIQTDVVREGTALHSYCLVTGESSADRAPQEKEPGLLNESSSFYVTQRARLSGASDGGRAIQKEDPRTKGKEGSRHQAAWPRNSSAYHISDRLKRRGSEWGHCMAWTLSLLLSVSCLVLSAVLGMRFSSGKVLLWIHSLFFSLVSCIFLIQPAVIISVAVAVSFWYRNRADFHRVSSVTEFSHPFSRNHADRPAEQFPQRCSYLEKLLGARQRARYLRLVRPPSPAELRKSRRTRRREALLHNTLRDLSVCGAMLLLMLCINYSNSLTDHNRLNKAARKHFISRDHDDAFMSIQKHEDWWKWAQTNLLNLLYKNASTAAGSHILIGEPVLWKTEVSGSCHSWVSGATASTHPQSNVVKTMPPKTCGRLGCYGGPSATVGFGHTKSEAASKLKLLHSGGWLGREMVAMKVQFTLFSPAPNLFTSVTMLAEQSPTGVLLPCAKVQSVRVYHTPIMWDYVVMVCQLLFLLLSLLQVYDQVYAVEQRGLMGYWRTPCSWLEVSLLAVTLVYYVYYIYRSVIILEVAELLQRQSHRGHVDVSLLATWEQNIRTLRGVILFLLIMKGVTVLRLNRTLAISTSILTHSLSRLFWPAISGFILMVALSCVGNLLFAQSSWGFSSLSRSLRTLLCHPWGPRSVRGLHLTTYHGLLYQFSTVMWTALVTGVVSSLVRSAKRSQSRGNVFTVAQLVDYVRRRVSGFTGQRRKAWIENQEEGKTYYFEEFESLVDELLCRLNALSNSPHHSLPPEAHRYREEDSPVFSATQEPCSVDAQDFLRTQMTPETTVSVPVDVSSSSNIIVASNKTPQHGTRAGENPNDRETKSYLKTQNRPSETASLIKVWTEDVLEQADQRTRANDSYWFSKSQAARTEVVVEVLVHKDCGV